MSGAKQTAEKAKAARHWLRAGVLGATLLLRHWLAWGLTVLAALLLGLYGFMQYLKTDGGRAWLSQTASRAASTPDMKVDVSIGDISLTRLFVPSLKIADAKGVFLQVEGLELGILPKTYILMRPALSRLDIARVYLARLPEMPEGGASAAANENPADWPQIAAELKSFNIGEIHVGEAVYGQEQFFSLKSSIVLSPRLAENDIDILLGAAAGRQASETTHAHVRLRVDEDDNLIADAALRDAAGGMVTRLMGLPAGYDVDFALQGKGPYLDWQGTAQLRLGRELSGNFLLRLQDNRSLRVEADLKGPQKVAVTGYVTLPLQLSPPVLSLDEKIAGRFSTALDLRSMTLLLGLDDHRLAGRAQLTADVGGSLRQPVVDGNGTVRDASYENLAAGVKLSALRADIAATRSDIRISGISARTAGRGTLGGHAEISLRNPARPSFSFDMTLDKAQVLGLQNAQVQASGGLKGTGDAAFMAIDGDITINKAEIYLAGFGSGSAASMLNIVEVNVPPHLRRAKRQAALPQGAYPIRLDIRADAPRAIFVRGQGLDSEWSAKAHVRGDAAEPQVDGYLKLIRGRYEFFDARMTFDSGLIDFSAGNLDNPDLDIKGSIKGKQVTANVAVSGTAIAPEVTLTSNPALPQDEILSRVFFDKSVTELTPMEMVRIAQIIGVMSGKLGGGAMDPISQLRKKAGIDMFSLNRDDKTGATSVSVGKYLSDGVYMSVDQGVNTEGSGVKLQIELKPNLQLETRVGSDNDNSVGINWKKDY